MSSANFKPKRTAAASRGFLATARLSCSLRTNLEAVLQSHEEWKRDGLQNSLLIQRVFNLF